MRLLLDQNPSPRLLSAQHRFVIVSKDADFHERSFVLAVPQVGGLRHRDQRAA